jgi:hypothetical protein
MRAVMRGGWHVGLIAGVCSITVAGCAALDRSTRGSERTAGSVRICSTGWLSWRQRIAQVPCAR